MKTTLFTLLLFLSCNLMGQIDPRMEAFLDTAAYEISEAHEFGLEGIIFTDKDYINAKIDKRIVELWDEYVLEFMNDSILAYPTIEDHALGVWVGVDQYGRDLRLSTSKPEWIHPTPTLPYFMEFIRRKTTN